jgi:hypothetical protein
MKNGRCKMHGGKSTGRPIIHGLRTKKIKAANMLVKNLVDDIEYISDQLLG